MDFRIRTLFFVVIAGLTFAELSSASVIFRPGEKAKYVAPGEEEMNGKAEELFHTGQAAEKEGNLKRAVRAYKSLVRRHPKDALAPGAVFRAAELQEQRQDLIAAAEMFRWLVEHYPSSPHFDEAIEGQFPLSGRRRTESTRRARSLTMDWHERSKERMMRPSRPTRRWSPSFRKNRSRLTHNTRLVTSGLRRRAVGQKI